MEEKLFLNPLPPNWTKEIELHWEGTKVKESLRSFFIFPGVVKNIMNEEIILLGDT